MREKPKSTNQLIDTALEMGKESYDKVTGTNSDTIDKVFPLDKTEIVPNPDREAPVTYRNDREAYTSYRRSGLPDDVIKREGVTTVFNIDPAQVKKVSTTKHDIVSNRTTRSDLVDRVGTITRNRYNPDAAFNVYTATKSGGRQERRLENLPNQYGTEIVRKDNDGNVVYEHHTDNPEITDKVLRMAAKRIIKKSSEFSDDSEIVA